MTWRYRADPVGDPDWNNVPQLRLEAARCACEEENNVIVIFCKELPQ